MHLPALDLLAQFTTEDIDWLVSNAPPTTIIAGGVLLNEAAISDKVFFVSDGLFDVYVRDAGGTDRKVSQVGRGQIIGEMSWLDKKPISATIKAAETSSVLALPTALLDEKLSGSDAFAARFYRALARMSSERVRAATARYTGAEPAGDAAISPIAPSNVSQAMMQQIAAFKDLLMTADKRALQAKGQIPPDIKARILADFRSFAKGANDIIDSGGIPEATRDALGKHLQKEILPYILLASTAERFYSKPRGYAGDYLTIEMMYNNVPAGTGRIGPLIDECFMREPAAEAVRNRRRLLTREIKQQHESQQPPVRVTSLACGPAREVFDAIAALGADALEFTALDIDHEALALLKTRIGDQKLNIRAEHANLIYLATGRQKLELPPQDLMYSIGLIDYFNDTFVIKLLDWIFDRLRPGGRVILGNFHPKNSDKAFMDYVLEWQLIHRDEAKMNELYAASKFGKPCTRIMFEEEGINLFAECVKD